MNEAKHLFKWFGIRGYWKRSARSSRSRQAQQRRAM